MPKKVRIVVLTCLRRDAASRCLEDLAKCRSDGVEIAAVILAHGSGAPRRRRLLRKVRKVMSIGLLGAINGVRMRKWYREPAKDIVAECRRLGIPFREIEGLNSAEMIAAFQELEPDLGVSLGNGYISPRVFDIPRLGMINLHTEILPAYQNAQSIIWPIFCNDPYTGYTIHEIVRKIDAGRILLQRRYPIVFKDSLEQTVRYNKGVTDAKYPRDVAYVVSNIESLKASAIEQKGGRCYTTPSIWQYLKMVINNRRYYRMQRKGWCA